MRLLCLVILLVVSAAMSSLGDVVRATSGEPSGDGRRHTVFMLVIDRLSLNDLLEPEMAVLRALSAGGGIGLANVRTAGDSGAGAGHLSLGTGQRSVGSDWAGAAFSPAEQFAGQPAGELYRALTGFEPDAQVVHLGINQLAALSPVPPGRLGAALREADIPVAVYGNADGRSGPGRFGVLVAMDGLGRVPVGEVGASVLTHDKDWPFLSRTDYDAVLELAVGQRGGGGLVVIELGDLARLESAADLVTADRLAALHRVTLERIGRFVERLAAAVIDTSAWLLLAVPFPAASEAHAGFLMTPVILAPLGESQPLQAPALLTSATTRRAGIVANLDILPTVLNFFGLDAAEASGHVIDFVSHPDPWRTIQAMYARITRVHMQRLPLIQPYFFVQLAAVLVSTAAVAGLAPLQPWKGRARTALLLLHLGLIAFPLTLLVLPLFSVPDNLIMLWAQVVLLTASLAFAAWTFRRRGQIWPIAVLTAATAAALWLDTAAGARLMQASHLGYDPIGGSRYYGIGNEYMGVLLGAATIAGGSLLDGVGKTARRLVLWGIAAAYTGIIATMASPLHGANVGGTIGAVLGLGSVFLLLTKRRLNRRDIILLLACVALVLTGTAIYDAMYLGERSSHLGSAVQQVAAAGGDPLWSLFERKLAMNIRLIRLTIWSRAFVVSLVAAAYFAFYPPKRAAALARRFPATFLAIRGSLIGALTILAVNDSGVVGAATFMIPVISTLLYLLLQLAGEDSVRRRSGARDAWDVLAPRTAVFGRSEPCSLAAGLGAGFCSGGEEYQLSYRGWIEIPVCPLIWRRSQ